MRSAKAGSVTVDFISVEHVEKADAKCWHLQCKVEHACFEKHDWTSQQTEIRTLHCICTVLSLLIPDLSTSHYCYELSQIYASRKYSYFFLTFFHGKSRIRAYGESNIHPMSHK